MQLKQLTDANQAKASDPRVSAWVSANAGTGKTTVLVNRMLRLLLHPQVVDKILDISGKAFEADRIDIRNRLTLATASFVQVDQSHAFRQGRSDPAQVCRSPTAIGWRPCRASSAIRRSPT